MTNHDPLPLQRRAGDFALASMAVAYPDSEFAASASTVLPSFTAHPGLGPLARTVGEPDGLTVVRAAYIDLFEHGKGRVPLYETEYGRMRGMSKGNDLADIAGFYQAFGLDLEGSETHEMLDHLAVELEFYATLLAKQAHLLKAGDHEGAEIVEDARRKFLVAHLGSFAPAVAGQATVREDPHYGALFAWCAELVAEECATLHACATPLDYFQDDELNRDMRCKSLPVLQ